MSIGADTQVKMNFRSKKVVLLEVSIPVLRKLILGAQDIISEAVKNHPYTDQTGQNTRSLGWAASGLGKTGFGLLSTGGGETSASNSGVLTTSTTVTVIVASSSGHGGFLEVGTRKMRAFPYIMPAYNKNKKAIMDSLKGIL